MGRNNRRSSEQAIDRQIVSDLLHLRLATAAVLGRQSYAYDLLDGAINTNHLESMHKARHEFDQLDDDLRDRVIAAAGMVC